MLPAMPIEAAMAASFQEGHQALAYMPFAPSSGAVVMGGFWTRPEWEAAGGGRILL
jgi:hypothetical protein